MTPEREAEIRQPHVCRSPMLDEALDAIATFRTERDDLHALFLKDNAAWSERCEAAEAERDAAISRSDAALRRASDNSVRVAELTDERDEALAEVERLKACAASYRDSDGWCVECNSNTHPRWCKHPEGKERHR